MEVGQGSSRVPGSCSYLGEGPQHRASDYSQLSLPSCRRRACPTLSAPCPRQPDERSASAPPTPPAPPPEAPPPARPEVAGAVAKQQQQSVELATARGAPAGPAPGPTKRPAEGCRESEAGESRARHASGVLGKEVSRRWMLC